MEKIEFKYRENGSPSLVTDKGTESDPVSYQGIATLKIGNEVYMGFGEYYAGHGEILTGIVYLCIPEKEKK